MSVRIACFLDVLHLLVQYSEQNLLFQRLVCFGPHVKRLFLRTETHPASYTLCSVSNIKQWVTFRNPVILNVMCRYQNLLEVNSICLHGIDTVFVLLIVNQVL